MDEDGWDWPWLLYIGRVWLHWTDEETMSKTPTQFFSQLEVHTQIQEAKAKAMSGESAPQSNREQVGYIDQVQGW